MAQPFGSLSPDEPFASTGPDGAPILDAETAGRMGAVLGQTWPAHLIKAIVGGAMAPGDAYSGKMPMAPPGSRREDFTDIPGAAQPNDEAVARSADLSGALAGWGTSVAQKGTLGMAGGRPPMAAPGAAPAVVAPPFYSALEQAVTNTGLNKGVGQQWLGTLKNTPGVKADEISALGLDRFLGDQRGAVTKQDVLDHIAKNKVVVQDVVKGGSGVRTLGDAAIADDVRLLKEHGVHPETNPEDAGTMAFLHEDGDFYPASDIHSLYREEAPHVGVAAQRVEDYFHGGGDVADAARPKFATHVLPGGENYREHLLTLPTTDEKVAWAFGDGDKLRALQRARDIGPLPAELEQQYADLSKRAAARDTAGDAYKSGHWDEPNVLAHMRTNDRLIPNAQGGVDKTLHLEEIQSDWHQAGRRKGYQTENPQLAPVPPEIQALMDKRLPDQLGRDPRTVGTATLDMTGRLNPAEVGQLRDWINANPVEFSMAGMRAASPKDAVPDAPFKTTWPELAMKRAIRHAAENGYDRVSWTPGEAQAARYDLSKQIDLVVYKDGKLTAIAKGGQHVINDKPVAEAELVDHIGKEAADKLINQDPHNGARTLNNADLKIGGDGMKGFYDKMLPSIANKIIKAHGSKVEQVNIGGAGGEKYFVDRHPSGSYEVWSGVEDAATPVKTFRTQSAADAWVASQEKSAPPLMVHSFKITPELRKAAIEKGFPLFSAGALATGFGAGGEGDKGE